MLKAFGEHSLPAAEDGRLTSKGKVCMHVTTHVKTVDIFLSRQILRLPSTQEQALTSQKVTASLNNLFIEHHRHSTST